MMSVLVPSKEKEEVRKKVGRIYIRIKGLSRHQQVVAGFCVVSRNGAFSAAYILLFFPLSATTNKTPISYLAI